MNEKTGAIQQLRQELVTALLAVPEENWGRIMEIGQTIVVLAEHLSKIREREKMT
jgi:hypothetical protein